MCHNQMVMVMLWARSVVCDHNLTNCDLRVRFPSCPHRKDYYLDIIDIRNIFNIGKVVISEEKPLYMERFFCLVPLFGLDKLVLLCINILFAEFLCILNGFNVFHSDKTCYFLT